MALLVQHNPGSRSNNNPSFCGCHKIQQGTRIHGNESSSRAGGVHIQPRDGKHDFAQQKIRHDTNKFICIIIIRIIIN